RLVLAPNMTLALEVLRMPAMELQAFLRQQAEENPLIEIEEAPEEQEEPTTTADSSSSSDQPKEDGDPKSLDEDWMDHWRTVSGTSEDPDNEDEHSAFENRMTKPESFHESMKVQIR